MRKIWSVIAALVVGLGLGLAVLGCGSSTGAGKNNMQSDKMGTGEVPQSSCSGLDRGLFMDAPVLTEGSPWVLDRRAELN